jgi:hypothetical protein
MCRFGVGGPGRAPGGGSGAGCVVTIPRFAPEPVYALHRCWPRVNEADSCASRLGRHKGQAYRRGTFGKSRPPSPITSGKTKSRYSSTSHAPSGSDDAGAARDHDVLCLHPLLTSSTRSPRSTVAYFAAGDEQAVNASTRHCQAGFAASGRDVPVIDLGTPGYQGSRQYGSNVTGTAQIVRWFTQLQAHADGRSNSWLSASR